MLLPHMLVEMLHVPARVMRPVLPEHPIDPVDRHPPGRCLAQPSVDQACKPFLLIAPPVTPELSLRHPKISPASCAESSLCSHRLNTSRNFCILRSCSHVVRFIVPLLAGHKTGQLVCYLTRTTHELTTQLVRNLASVPEYERIDLQFALGKAYEDLKQHERSFRHLLAGNKLKRAQIHYDEAEAMDYMQRIRAVFDAALCRAKAGGGEPAPTPVFIVGMPRSGTTLIEQIIASHPKAVGAGELFDFDNIVQSLTGLNGGALSFPEVVATMSGEQLRQVGARYLAAVRALAPTAERVADKMPWNFHFPGLIHLALPNARIIHARRDPVDTCLSCFSILFEGAGNPFTYDLGELGRFYRAYDSLMAHWRAVLPPGLMLEVRYEEVVGELEKQARSIIAHCGLEWDDACLAFHATRRPVRTSSVAQVRKPIYHSSVGRWRPYRDQLRPLFEELGIDSENESAPSAPPSPVAVAGRIQPAITGPEIHQTPTTAAPRPDTIAPISKDQSWRVSGHVTTTKWIVAAGAALALLSVVALAQAPSPQQIWERMPHMQLEAEYAGPMKDTTIQRWRDPGLNVVCYLYLPFTAQHSTPTASGYVQYGANTIGTISCLPVLASAPPKANGPAPSAAKATPPPQGRP